MTEQKQTRGFGFYCSWFFAVWFLLGALSAAFTFVGFLRLVMGLTLLPPFGAWVRAKHNFVLSRKLKTIILVSCFLIMGFVGGPAGGSGDATPAQSDQDWWAHFYADYYAPR